MNDAHLHMVVNHFPIIGTIFGLGILITGIVMKKNVIKNNQYLKWWEYTNKELAKYKNDQKSTISYMVKEFEMKKAADLYKRSTVSKTILPMPRIIGPTS